MKTNGILALSALGALTAAAPLANNDRRDVAYAVVTDVVLETVWTTTTVWVDPTAAASAAQQSIGAFFESYSPPAPVTTSSAAPVVPSSSSAPPPPPPAPTTTSTSTEAPPPASPTPAPATTQAPAPPPASTPTPQAAAAAPPAPAPAQSSASSSSSSGSSSGQGEYSGDITYYDVSVGLGSCGWQGSNSQDLVAVAADVMQNGANPNANPNCGKMINIYYNGQTTQAEVYDTCPTCEGGSLDLTQELFQKVAPNGDGRVHGVSWSWA